MVVGRSGRPFPIAEREMTGPEIEEAFAALLVEAELAFLEDFAYLSQMAENATSVLAKRRG